MDYKLHYDTLVTRARGRTLSGYTETHHIVPLCVGGLDVPDNLVVLTAREHYIAHALLVKIYYNTEHIHKLVYAFNFMCCDSHNGNRINGHSKNKTYALARELFSKFHPMHNIETKEKMMKSLQAYYDNTPAEDRYRVDRITVECACGCGGTFIKKETEKKIYLPNHGRKQVWSDPDLLDRQSKMMSNLISKLAPEELSVRIRNSLGSADPVARGKAISAGKSGKKTNQKEIEILKYGTMSEIEFENFIDGRTKAIQTRMKNRRQIYYDRINNS